MLDSLREKANNLPLLPGVYIMLDEHGESYTSVRRRS